MGKLYNVTFFTTVEADSEEDAIMYAQDECGHWEAELL